MFILSRVPKVCINIIDSMAKVMIHQVYTTFHNKHSMASPSSNTCQVHSVLNAMNQE